MHGRTTCGTQTQEQQREGKAAKSAAKAHEHTTHAAHAAGAPHSSTPPPALNHFDLQTVFTEWAHLAQDRAGWHKLVTKPTFDIGKPFVRQPWGDIRVTPEDKRRAVAQRAAEVAERRAVFDADNNNWEAKVVHWQPFHTQAVARTRIPSSTRAVHGD